MSKQFKELNKTSKPALRIQALTCFLTLYVLSIHGQSFSINTDGTIAHPSALLEVKSNAKGLLLPRMTKLQKNTITAPATGLLVYQTAPDSIGFHYYDGTTWIWLEPLNNSAWRISGNAGTNSELNFIGTTDNTALSFRLNNSKAGIVDHIHQNVMLGMAAGRSIPAGSSYAKGNVVIGDSAGAVFFSATNSFLYQTFIGKNAGRTISGANSRNTFVGANAGDGLTTTSNSVTLGYDAGANSPNLNSSILIGVNAQAGGTTTLLNATAIGANAQVNTSNCMVLGSLSGINGASTTVNVGIGVNAPLTRLHMSGALAVDDFTEPNIIANNGTITVENRTYIKVSANNTPINRNTSLSNGLAPGQLLILEGTGATATNGIRLEDADANLNIASATFDVVPGSTITLIWNGTVWVELHRSINGN